MECEALPHISRVRLQKMSSAKEHVQICIQSANSQNSGEDKENPGESCHVGF